MWNKEWLLAEYVTKRRSSGDIATELNVTDNAVWFWLKKHGIKCRTTSEARSAKHWGSFGDKNPMCGKFGVLNPNWKGGLTPLRQRVYSTSEYRKVLLKVVSRDKKCRLCGSTEKMQVHHIQPFSQAPLFLMDYGNMIVLCAKCHQKMRGKEDLWKKLLFDILSQKGG
jgi:hypothetical protein